MSEEENVDIAKHKEGELTKTLLFATLISSFGSSFQYGYNLFVINYPAEFLKNFYNETYRERNHINIDSSILMFLWGLTVTFFPVGAILGSLLVGPLVDACGRGSDRRMVPFPDIWLSDPLGYEKHLYVLKGTLLANDALVIVSAIFLGSSKKVHSYELIIVGRLIVGGSVGIAYSVVPMYVTELAPPNLRCTLGMVPHLFIIFGELLANLFGLHNVLGTEEGWPLLLSLIALPALFQIILLPFFPESPRYLMIQQGNEKRARQALKELRGWDDVEEEMEELFQEGAAAMAEKNMDVLTMMNFEDLQFHLTTIIILMGSQQLSGINAIHYYATKIYLSIGLEEKQASYVSLILTGILIFISIIALCVVESFGPRSLLLTGFGICSISCILLAMSIELQKTISWMPQMSSAFLTLFLIGQTIGPDPITNVIVSELFLQSSRSTAFVITGTLHWLCKLLITTVYLSIETHLEPYSFLIFWPLGVAAFISLRKKLLDTRNKTFMDIKRIVALHVARTVLMRSLAVSFN